MTNPRTFAARPLRAFAVALAAVAVFATGALAATAFTDVADNHPASAEIAAAHQIGVFNGYGDGTFRPDVNLTQRQAENVIWRMLSWQGTDDDGNFEISRADAAVLAMTGLCGLAADRIPACAAVRAADQKAAIDAAYDEGYDAGISDAEGTGGGGSRTPPPTSGEPPTVNTPAGGSKLPVAAPADMSALARCRRMLSNRDVGYWSSHSYQWPVVGVDEDGNLRCAYGETDVRTGSALIGPYVYFVCRAVSLERVEEYGTERVDRLSRHWTWSVYRNEEARRIHGRTQWSHADPDLVTAAHTAYRADPKTAPPSVMDAGHCWRNAYAATPNVSKNYQEPTP